MEASRYFAGANTAEGFYSRFDDILPRDARRRMFYIKGGPGVGKSTLMRRVGERAEAAGLDVEYFFCSSDPRSLDGVAIPSRGLAIMDGTAPHVYDPVVPAARDTLISLGDHLDEKRLRPHMKEIDALMSDISSRFKRCYEYLGAAKRIRAAASRGAESPAKAFRAAQALGDALPRRGGDGSVRRLFGAAVTPEGLVDLFKQDAYPRVFGVDCPFGHCATRLLSLVAQRAAAQGLHAIELLDPLCPDELRRVVLPEHGLCFLAEQRGGREAGEWLAPDSVFELTERAEHETSYDVNAYELLTQRAVEQLRAAKSLHDELERFYVGAMDYDAWEKVSQALCGELEAAFA